MLSYMSLGLFLFLDKSDFEASFSTSKGLFDYALLAGSSKQFPNHYLVLAESPKSASCGHTTVHVTCHMTNSCKIIQLANFPFNIAGSAPVDTNTTENI